MEKVSVIVPVYNAENCLQRCVNSIINQTYTNIELILVNDGSQDFSPKICDMFADTYSNIKVIHKDNGGLSSARLFGFLEAAGNYILFVDSDDYIEPIMIEELVSSIIKYNADISICSYNTLYGDQVIRNKLPYNLDYINSKAGIEKQYILPLIGPETYNEIRLPGFVCIRLYKKSLLSEDYFLSEREYFLEDHIFNLLYADRVSSIAFVNKQLYNYCVNYDSLSNCYRKEKWRMYENIIKWYNDYIAERDIEGVNRRLENFIRIAVCSSVDNAVNEGSYDGFLKEISIILNSECFKAIKKEHDIHLFDSRNITISLLKLRMFRVLYTMRLFRIKKRRKKT